MNLRNEISKRVAQIQHIWIGRPDHVIFFGFGIGDDLLCTALARELKKRGAGKIVMFSKYSALFEQNPDISGVYDRGLQTIGRQWTWGYSGIVPQYSLYDPQTDRDNFRKEHLIATMCRIAGLTGTVGIRPYLTLLPSEKAAGELVENQIAIQSGGLGTIKNKDWFPERYQAVVDLLKNDFGIVHLGQKTDPPLEGALDLRGKTTLRESAAILASSRVFVGQVGFLMHLARAVDCRSVIVYGGREEPLVSGYRENENIVGLTPCAPCWQRNKCDYGHECMRMIEPEEVIAAVRSQLKREGTLIEAEQVDLGSAPPPIDPMLLN